MLLDTTVYVDALNGQLPVEVEVLARTRASFRVPVVIAALSNWFGSLSPASPRSRQVLSELAGVIGDIPRHRIESVTEGVMLEAGIMSGLVHRLGGLQPVQHLHAVNDAAIYLHAVERGHTVLTRNIRDFDFMQQILPAGNVLFHRTIQRSRRRRLRCSSEGVHPLVAGMARGYLRASEGCPDAQPSHRQAVLRPLPDG